MNLTLSRLNSSSVQPTMGVLSFNGVPLWVTLEPPDLDNQFKKSCIPLGNYQCKRVYDRVTSGGMEIAQTYHILDVPDRDSILFHIGNDLKDTEGCVLVGLYFSNLTSYKISSSSIAFHHFVNTTRGSPYLALNIRGFPDAR